MKDDEIVERGVNLLSKKDRTPQENTIVAQMNNIKRLEENPKNAKAKRQYDILKSKL